MLCGTATGASPCTPKLWTELEETLPCVGPECDAQQVKYVKVENHVFKFVPQRCAHLFFPMPHHNDTERFVTSPTKGGCLAQHSNILGDGMQLDAADGARLMSAEGEEQYQKRCFSACLAAGAKGCEVDSTGCVAYMQQAKFLELRRDRTLGTDADLHHLEICDLKVYNQDGDRLGLTMHDMSRQVMNGLLGDDGQNLIVDDDVSTCTNTASGDYGFEDHWIKIELQGDVHAVSRVHLITTNQERLRGWTMTLRDEQDHVLHRHVVEPYEITSHGVTLSRFQIAWYNPQYSDVKCPAGTEQVGVFNADIGGCGLERCQDRYGLPSADACRDRCNAHAKCLAFTWAPPEGDREHVETSVCTLYDTDLPESLRGPEQVLCKLREAEAGVPRPDMQLVAAMQRDNEVRDSVSFRTFGNRAAETFDGIKAWNLDSAYMELEGRYTSEPHCSRHSLASSTWTLSCSSPRLLWSP